MSATSWNNRLMSAGEKSGAPVRLLRAVAIMVGAGWSPLVGGASPIRASPDVSKVSDWN
jgi:hypothetical protein